MFGIYAIVTSNLRFKTRQKITEISFHWFPWNPVFNALIRYDWYATREQL